MFLLEVRFPYGITAVQKELISPSSSLQIDPRPIPNEDNPNGLTFNIIYHDNGNDNDTPRVTITRISGWDNRWPDDDEKWKFRVYDPTKEIVPSFDSTTYTYLGVDGERAPHNTVVGIIDPSIRVIKEYAFFCCEEMKICLMQHDNVIIIEAYAFGDCCTMKTIRLSRNIKRIGDNAFADCKSLDSLFLPPEVNEIHGRAFWGCTNIRILALPPTIDLDQVGNNIVEGCDTLFRITEIQQCETEYFSDDELGEGLVSIYTLNCDEVHRSLLDFYRHLPPLHKACLDTNVTARKIHDSVHRDTVPTHRQAQAEVAQAAAITPDHGGMTPLHILAMNPHATSESILACLYLNMRAALTMDHSAKTPIDYLRRHENVDGLISIMQALRIHREGGGLCDTAGTSLISQNLSKRRRVN